jgi:membrane dipeptidase
MNNSRQEWTRRKIISTATGVATAIALSPLLSWANSQSDDPLIAKIVAGTIGTDTHNHIDVPLDSSTD